MDRSAAGPGADASWLNDGTAAAYAIRRLHDVSVIGSMRFWNLERWGWPARHPRRDAGHIDACEIGHTWFTRSAVRTAAHTETKLLMLQHAFETWSTLRVYLHTDHRNERSQAAIARLGASREGVLRAHRLGADGAPRDSVRFSIVAAHRPVVRDRLHGLLERR